MTKKKSLLFYLQEDRQLLLIVFVPLAYVIVFNYVPMYGVQIGFKDFDAAKGVWFRPWDRGAEGGGAAGASSREERGEQHPGR